jgi:hypothetical protein
MRFFFLDCEHKPRNVARGINIHCLFERESHVEGGARDQIEAASQISHAVYCEAIRRRTRLGTHWIWR